MGIVVQDTLTRIDIMMMKPAFIVLTILGLFIQQANAAGGAIASALLGAGAQLLSSDAGGGGLWVLPTGQKIDPNKCWQDGSGPCANGNCLDNDGRRGIVIKETTVGCKWFCVHRSHCKTQICCRSE